MASPLPILVEVAPEPSESKGNGISAQILERLEKMENTVATLDKKVAFMNNEIILHRE